jgi:hypothetical protein
VRRSHATVLPLITSEEQAQGFVATELDHPTGEFVVFSVRPRHWHSLDFSDLAR